MTTTDMKENGFELAIDKVLVETNGFERGNLYGIGEYNCEYAVDEARLFRFLDKRQAAAVEALHILISDLEKSKFLKALSDKIRKDGIIEVLRHGMRYKHLRLDLYEPANTDDFNENIWSVTRQLRYSEEDFILDVLKNYTPVDIYYNLVAKVQNDPQFNKKKVLTRKLSGC